MKILSHYNTPIKVEEGDLIAVDEVRRQLWIRVGNDLFTVVEPLDSLNLEERIHINSAGSYVKQETIFPALEWKEYYSENKSNSRKV